MFCFLATDLLFHLVQFQLSKLESRAIVWALRCESQTLSSLRSSSHMSVSFTVVEGTISSAAVTAALLFILMDLAVGADKIIISITKQDLMTKSWKHLYHGFSLCHEFIFVSAKGWRIFSWPSFPNCVFITLTGFSQGSAMCLLNLSFVSWFISPAQACRNTVIVNPR